MNKIAALTIVVLMFVSCSSDPLPNGFYVQEDATPFNCITFEIRNDTILWKSRFSDEKSKDFVYNISGDELRGECITEDERMIKPCMLVENGVILDGKVFRQYNPNIDKLPEGNYQNYDAVPQYTHDLQVRGDSIFTQYYRYEELRIKTKACVKLKGRNKLCFMDPKSDEERVVNFQVTTDGFIIDELRYVKLDDKK